MKHRLVALLAAALLGGCGGGLYVELGPDDDPPSVSLASADTSALPGQALRLVAAASDDDYVSEVEFYRIDSRGRAVYLGTDYHAPYDWDTLMPDVPVGDTVSYFARAFDSSDQSSDSDTVDIRAL